MSYTQGILILKYKGLSIFSPFVYLFHNIHLPYSVIDNAQEHN